MILLMSVVESFFAPGANAPGFLGSRRRAGSLSFYAQQTRGGSLPKPLTPVAQNNATE